jgi:23S rRNA (guanosine2251-2'-O)-methyltransferase
MDWIYGRQVARLALAPGARRRPHRLSATTAALADLERHGTDLGGVPHETHETHDLDRLTGSHEHQGVALLVDGYPYADADRLLRRDLVVVLDEVTDPRNVGAIARSALAAGAGGLALPRHRSAAITPAAVKASAGATEHLDIARVTNVVAYLADLKRSDFWVYGAAGDAAVSYRELDCAGKVALVFGAEGSGLRPLVRRACDVVAAIPVREPIDSLNVSVAAALFLYEAAAARDVAGRGGSGLDEDHGAAR